MLVAVVLIDDVTCVQMVVRLLLACLDRHVQRAEVIFRWSLMTLDNLLHKFMLVPQVIVIDSVSVTIGANRLAIFGARLQHFLMLKWVVAAQVIHVLLDLPCH